MSYWIVIGIIALVLIGVYVVLGLYARKRQKKWDEQYRAAKERHEVFVLHKKVLREKGPSGWQKYAKFKTYQVTGRVSVSQAVKGVQMSRMQTVTFYTSKDEYERIAVNHKYKMDIAGNYIGYVVGGSAPVKGKSTKVVTKAGKGKDGKGTEGKSKAAKEAVKNKDINGKDGKGKESKTKETKTQVKS